MSKPLLKSKIYLGIDPGLINTGWGIISYHNSKINLIDCGNISVSTNLSIELRLAKIFQELKKIIESFNPDECAVEDIFVNKNNKSSLKLGYARAVALLTIGLANKKIFEYSPNLVKKAIVGKGKASKEQVQYMINHIIPKAKITNEHIADAIAVAICHAHHTALER